MNFEIHQYIYCEFPKRVNITNLENSRDSPRLIFADSQVHHLRHIRIASINNRSNLFWT